MIANAFAIDISTAIVRVRNIAVVRVIRRVSVGLRITALVFNFISQGNIVAARK